MRTLNDILAYYKRPKDRELIKRAYAVANNAHTGQTRKSGEPYITHPLETAYTLSQMNMDSSTISAALLHDTIEDTDTTLEIIEKEFGKEISHLVDGVTKLGKVKYRDSDQDAENLRKMLLATAEDIRVVLIKCADRLHNMQTLSALPRAKQQRKALETMEIYAPIALRLGVWEIAKELEDLAFPYLYPKEYEKITMEVQSRLPEREKYLERVMPIISKMLKENNVTPIEIQTRSKNLYSLYQKLNKYNGNWDMIRDLVAARIIVSNIPECYATLGIIHNIWHPHPGRIKDYISMPKTNGYQSLHTTVFCLDGIATEFQIRTPEMHEHAEHGIAAHWAYTEQGKESSKMLDPGNSKLSWVSQIRDWQKELPESEEFLEAMKIDLFRNRIFILTPKGKVVDLPEGATPVDFAYSIHSALGHECNGARVNGKYVPLSYELKSGDIVEIDRKSQKGPSHAWLEFVKTNQARSHIRAWFKRENKGENTKHGLELVNKELQQGYNATWSAISNQKKEEALSHFTHKTLDDLLAGIGSGEVSLQRVIRRLIDEKEALGLPAVTPLIRYPKFSPLTKGNVQIANETGLKTRIAKCCNPVPGERIAAYVATTGIASVHKKQCAYIQDYTSAKNERVFPAHWQTNAGKNTIPISLIVRAQDRVGLLQDIASAISELGVNIISIQSTTEKDIGVVFTAMIEIHSLQELQRVLKKIKTVRSIDEVRRV